VLVEFSPKVVGVTPPPPAAASSATRDVPGSVDQTYAQETLSRAIAVLGDVRAEDDDREDAGRVILVLLRPACPTEADLADLITALSRALHVHLAIRRVLGALQGMRPPAVVEAVGRGVEHLMDQAFRAGDCDALCELILVTLDEPRWSPRLRDEWGKAVFTNAVNHLPAAKYPAAFLIAGFLSERGEVPTWMREVVEERPDLVSSSLLALATRWQLHHAVPTVAAWKSLAGVRGVKPVLEPPTFGSSLDVAVETLKQAIGETPDGDQGPVLRCWHHELTGSTA